MSKTLMRDGVVYFEKAHVDKQREEFNETLKYWTGFAYFLLEHLDKELYDLAEERPMDAIMFDIYNERKSDEWEYDFIFITALLYN